MQKYKVGDGVYFGGAAGNRYMMCVTGDGAGYERVCGGFKWRGGSREVVHIDLFDNAVDGDEDGLDVLASIELLTPPISGSDGYDDATRSTCELFGTIYAVLTDSCGVRNADNVSCWLPQMLDGRADVRELYVKG